MNTNGVERKVHASRVESECAFREHKRATGEWIPEARVPLLRGTAVHAARERYLKTWLIAKAAPSLEECQDAAETGVECRVEKDMKVGILTEPEAVTEALDDALPMVEADYRLALADVAPHVVAVEETLEAPVGDTGWILTGTLDARGVEPMTGAGLVSDLKTGAPRDPQTEADLSTQLSNYALLHRAHFGTIPAFALDHIWTMKRGPTKDRIERDRLAVCALAGDLVGVRMRVTTSRTPGDLEAALRVLRFRIDAEAAGWYPPAFGGYQSPCMRCENFAAADPSQRCPWRPGYRSPSREEVSSVR